MIDNLPPPPNTEEVQKAVYGKLPNYYQEMIKKYLAIFLKDPYSVKYDFRSEPSKGYIQYLKINKGCPTFGWLVFSAIIQKIHMVLIQGINIPISLYIQI